MFGTLLSCNGTGVHEPPGVGLVRWSDSQHMAITKALLGCYAGIWYTSSDKVSRFLNLGNLWPGTKYSNLLILIAPAIRGLWPMLTCTWFTEAYKWCQPIKQVCQDRPFLSTRYWGQAPCADLYTFSTYWKDEDFSGITIIKNWSVVIICQFPAEGFKDFWEWCSLLLNLT